MVAPIANQSPAFLEIMLYQQLTQVNLQLMAIFPFQYAPAS
uniref:Uncharacterized protein n=1 Tax=Tetranychus urticae TaxID=32264 RepID=T1K137_TETUR